MKVLIYGASENPERYSYQAAQLLLQKGHQIVLIGAKKGLVFEHAIQTNQVIEPIDTVTLYVGPKNQVGLLEYMLKLKPKRVIFNPGTEHAELENELTQHGINVEEACTLVLLHTGQF